MAAKQDHFKFTWDIEPHILLPSQMGPRRAWTPEQRLCWAVLEAVQEDLGRPEPRFHKGGGRHRSPRPSRRDAALGYIYANEHYWYFSFTNVCAQIGIDPDAYRSALARKEHAA